MREQKQFHYWYDTILAEGETEIDMNGDTVVPVKEDTRKRHEKLYKVVFVRAIPPSESPFPILTEVVN
jgi:hypothetical protein